MSSLLRALKEENWEESLGDRQTHRRSGRASRQTMRREEGSWEESLGGRQRQRTSGRASRQSLRALRVGNWEESLGDRQRKTMVVVERGWAQS